MPLPCFAVCPFPFPAFPSSISSLMTFSLACCDRTVISRWLGCLSTIYCTSSQKTHNISIIRHWKSSEEECRDPMSQLRQLRSTVNSINSVTLEFAQALAWRACSPADRPMTFDTRPGHSSTRVSLRMPAQDSYGENSSFRTVALPTRVGTRESTHPRGPVAAGKRRYRCMDFQIRDRLRSPCGIPQSRHPGGPYGCRSNRGTCRPPRLENFRWTCHKAPQPPPVHPSSVSGRLLRRNGMRALCVLLRPYGCRCGL